MEAAKPFSVSTSVTIRGGYSQVDKPFQVETEVIENIHFVGISSKDFRLLAALGCAKPLQSSAGKIVGYQCETSPVLMYIKQLRDKAVNALDDDSEADKPEALFLKFDIPRVCAVRCKQLIASDRTVHLDGLC